jgi:hypothetical protein
MQMYGLLLVALAAEALVLVSAGQFRKSMGLGGGEAAATRLGQTPMERVVTLITELEAKVQANGKAEGTSYDQYACWCESTLARKAGDISDAKTTIEDATNLIQKLKGEVATHGAEIANMNHAIDANLASQRDAADAREREKEEYTGEKTESEQCIGALEAAINVLNGAGAGNKGTMKEAQLLSVVAGVRGILTRPLVTRVMTPVDMKLVKSFVERPEDFMGLRQEMDGLSAVQVANNPFGDFAPQSTQVQGILKGMYDAFAADLEKANAEESVEQKAFNELMAVKRTELKTLRATLEHHEVSMASKQKQEAETKQLRDDSQAQLAADEQFFAETKAACQTKAKEWAERTRLRTEELQGMRKAIQILSSSAAQRTFVNATTTLLQVASIVDGVRKRAFQRLQSTVGKYHSLRLAQIAATLQTGGHFDKVIEAIDQMMTVLRQEEQDDITHRDRCQVGTGKNSNDMEDLNHAIGVSEKSLEGMDGKKNNLMNRISELEAEINATRGDMAEVLSLRNKASADFVQALKDDQDAIGLLTQAIASLTKFYETNNIPLSLLSKQSPEYSIDEDKAPETTWNGGNYGGRDTESGGIIAILSLIKEDLEKEIKTARSDDAAAQGDYAKQRDAMQATVDKTKATKTATAVTLADLQGEIQDTEAAKIQQNKDLGAQDELKAALYSDCSWVKTHFATRREKRKAEMDGLTDAKSYLAGVEAGDEV